MKDELALAEFLRDDNRFFFLSGDITQYKYMRYWIPSFAKNMWDPSTCHLTLRLSPRIDARRERHLNKETYFRLAEAVIKDRWGSCNTKLIRDLRGMRWCSGNDTTAQVRTYDESWLKDLCVYFPISESIFNDYNVIVGRCNPESLRQIVFNICLNYHINLRG